MRLIDADAINYRNDRLHDVSDDFIKGIEYVNDCINDAPTIDAVPRDFHDKTCKAMAERHAEEVQGLIPKRGEWIVNYIGMFECTACNKMTFSKSRLWVYCPYCGARMKGADDGNK